MLTLICVVVVFVNIHQYSMPVLKVIQILLSSYLIITVKSLIIMVLSPALHSACKGGSVDIVDLLLRNKCNINQCQIVRKLGERKKQTFDYMMYIHIYVLHSLFIRQITVKVYCYYCNRNNVCTNYFWKTLSW